MTPEVLERSFRLLVENPERLAQPLMLAWHAGEPLAMPPDFYEKAFATLRDVLPTGMQVEHWIQTNATLITPEWCALFKKWDVHIGVSIDGPHWINDLNRLDRRGHSTFDRALRGILWLQSEGIDFSTITVLSDRSLDYPEAIWRFLRDLGLKSIAFNLEDIDGEHATTSLLREASPERVENFFRNILELRETEAPEVHVRELDESIDNVWRAHEGPRRIENIAGGVISINWKGQISSFSPEMADAKHARYGDFIFGHVERDSLPEFLLKPKLQRVAREVESGVARCKASCEYFSLCGGGTPSTKLFENGSFDSAETLACRLRVKAIAHVVLDFLERKRNFSSSAGTSVLHRLERLRSTLHEMPACQRQERA